MTVDLIQSPLFVGLGIICIIGAIVGVAFAIWFFVSENGLIAGGVLMLFCVGFLVYMSWVCFIGPYPKTPLSEQYNAYYHTTITDSQLRNNCGGERNAGEIPDVNDVWVCDVALVQNGTVIADKFQIKRTGDNSVKIYYTPYNDGAKAGELIELTQGNNTTEKGE
jgi:hypothetical protein